MQSLLIKIKVQVFFFSLFLAILFFYNLRIEIITRKVVIMKNTKPMNTVKPVLSGHLQDPRYCPLNRGIRLVQVHFTENKGSKIGLY